MSASTLAAPEVPAAQECLARARTLLREGNRREAGEWLLRVVDDDSAFLPWQAGAQLLDQVELDEPLRTARSPCSAPTRPPSSCR